MTASALMAEPVVLLDLRGIEGDRAALRAWEALAGHRHRHGGRVLVVDLVHTMVERHSVFEALSTSKLVHAVACVAVGGPVGEDSRPVLRAPATLNTDNVVTLWVGDGDGVGWDIGLATASAPEPLPIQGSALDVLLEALRLPEVFDEVVRLGGLFPARTASPGMLMRSSVIGPDQLAVLQAGAQRAVVSKASTGPAWRQPALESELRTVLLGGPDRRLADEIPTPAAGSPVDKLCREAATACRHLSEDVEHLAGPLGPALSVRGDAWAAAVRAGDAVHQLREFVTEQFASVGGRAGLEQSRHDRLRRLGLPADPLPDSDPESIVVRLHDSVTSALQAGAAIDTVGRRLRELAERAAPMGSGAHLDRLGQCCPEEVITRLRRPARFLLQPAQPWLLAALAGCGLLAGLLHWGAAVAVALLWALGLVLAMSTRPDPNGRSGAPVPYALPGALAGAVATGVGCAVALGVRSVIDIPAVAGAVPAALAVIGLVLILRRWWYAAVRRWIGLLGVADARQAVSSLQQLLMDVALREWAMADARRFTADAAGAMAAAVTLAGATLSRHATRLAGPAGGGWAASAASGTGEVAQPRLEEFVRADVCDAVLAALIPCWERLRPGVTGSAVHEGLDRRLDGLLDGYREHVCQRGLDDPPAFVAPSRQRQPVTGLLWQGGDVIDQLVSRAPADGLMRQLCAAEDLAVLLASGSHTQAIRFAPQLTQQDLGAVSAGLIWTRSTHLAGVLRLVPLRDGAVEQSWAMSADDDRDLA